MDNNSINPLNAKFAFDLDIDNLRICISYADKISTIGHEYNMCYIKHVENFKYNNVYIDSSFNRDEFTAKLMLLFDRYKSEKDFDNFYKIISLSTEYRELFDSIYNGTNLGKLLKDFWSSYLKFLAKRYSSPSDAMDVENYYKDLKIFDKFKTQIALHTLYISGLLCADGLYDIKKIL